MKEIKSNGLENIISQAIEEMKSEQGDHFSLEKINLAELERRTGISRAKLRRFKKNGFVFKPHGLEGRKAPRTILTGYTAILDDLLRNGITNSSVCLERLRAVGFPGGLTAVNGVIDDTQNRLIGFTGMLIDFFNNRFTKILFQCSRIPFPFVHKMGQRCTVSVAIPGKIHRFSPVSTEKSRILLFAGCYYAHTLYRY